MSVCSGKFECVQVPRYLVFRWWDNILVTDLHPSPGQMLVPHLHSTHHLDNCFDIDLRGWNLLYVTHKLWSPYGRYCCCLVTCIDVGSCFSLCWLKIQSFQVSSFLVSICFSHKLTSQITDPESQVFSQCAESAECWLSAEYARSAYF